MQVRRKLSSATAVVVGPACPSDLDCFRRQPYGASGVRDGTLISCSAFKRHRHDAPAQYDRGRTLYPGPGGCCSDDSGAVGVDDADGADGGCCSGAGGVEGSDDDAGGSNTGSKGTGGADGDGKDDGSDLSLWLALTLRLVRSSDARLGEQVGHFELALAVAGGRWRPRGSSAGSNGACASRRGGGR
jgi:hypothetical protein